MNETTLQPKFWIVWCPQGGNPSFRHPTWASAEAEAKRLSQQPNNHQRDFIVLEAVGGQLSYSTHVSVNYHVNA